MIDLKTLNKLSNNKVVFMGSNSQNPLISRAIAEANRNRSKANPIRKEGKL